MSQDLVGYAAMAAFIGFLIGIILGLWTAILLSRDVKKNNDRAFAEREKQSEADIAKAKQEGYWEAMTGMSNHLVAVKCGKASFASPVSVPSALSSEPRS